LPSSCRNAVDAFKSSQPQAVDSTALRHAAGAMIRAILIMSSLAGAMVSTPRLRAQDVGDAAALHARFVDYSDEPLRHKIDHSIKILEDALRVFGPDAVYASFNGGKDACVILHLLRAARHAHAVKSSNREKPKCIYFDASDDFGEVRTFVRDTCEALSDELAVEPVAPDVGYVDGLKKLVSDAKPRALAFVLGTRQGDPNCGDQKPFEPSSEWMPAFMRVNPILDWSYGDVWSFLRTFDLPYCSLYDEGYTSLGSVSSTKRNPALLSNEEYKPAFMLEDWSLERAGRVEKPRKKAAVVP
jgi:FAD synthetase